MTENIKPLIEQLKQTLSNREQLREKVIENINTARTVVESQAKTLVQQSKDSKVMNEYVIPLLKSEKTEQALKSLNQRLGQLPILAKVEKLRNDLIESKSEAVTAQTADTQAEPVSTQAANVSEASAESEKSETSTAKTRKSKSSEAKN